MSQPVKLAAQLRAASAAAVRRSHGIPGVLYGHGLTSQSVQVDGQGLEKALQEAGTTSLVTLTVEGKDHPVIIRDVQYHPLRGTLQHVDFYQVRLDEAIHAKVPLTFAGEAPAVKDLSGVLVRNLDELELEALPQNLPHGIVVDISYLDTFEKTIRVSDLKLPAGVKVLQEADTVVALVQPPRSEEELEALTEEVKEDVETVEGMKTKAEEAAVAEATGETAPAAPGKEAEPKKEG
ncbi:MAG: 50S ribosomal protein L25 [Patescibacteria group bacterium]